MKAIVFTQSGDYYQSTVFGCCFIDNMAHFIVLNQTKTNLILQPVWVYHNHQITTLIKPIDDHVDNWIANETLNYATIDFLYDIDLITAISTNTLPKYLLEKCLKETEPNLDITITTQADVHNFYIVTDYLKNAYIHTITYAQDKISVVFEGVKSCAIEMTFIGQPEFHAILNQHAEHWDTCTLLIKNGVIALINDKINHFTDFKDYTIWFKSTSVHYSIIPKLDTYHNDIILNTKQGHIILCPKNNQTQFYFVDIIFDNHSRPYTYLCTDDSIKAGDYVIVPVDANIEEKRVYVNDAYYATSEALHYPIHKMKMVISKVNDEVTPSKDKLMPFESISDELEDLTINDHDFTLIHQTVDSTQHTYDMNFELISQMIDQYNASPDKKLCLIDVYLEDYQITHTYLCPNNPINQGDYILVAVGQNNVIMYAKVQRIYHVYPEEITSQIHLLKIVKAK